MLEDVMIDAFMELIKQKFKGLKFNYKVEGIITEVVDANTYKVRIQNNIETIKSMNSDTYLLNDVVYIMVFNNNDSDKKILCKK